MSGRHTKISAVLRRGFSAALSLAGACGLVLVCSVGCGCGVSIEGLARIVNDEWHVGALWGALGSIMRFCTGRVGEGLPGLCRELAAGDRAAACARLRAAYEPCESAAAAFPRTVAAGACTARVGDTASTPRAAPMPFLSGVPRGGSGGDGDVVTCARGLAVRRRRAGACIVGVSVVAATIVPFLPVYCSPGADAGALGHPPCFASVVVGGPAFVVCGCLWAVGDAVRDLAWGVPVADRPSLGFSLV